jgi:hypothetical protein
MKICRRPLLGISYQLLRQKPWRYYTHARVQAGTAGLMRTRVNLRFLEFSFFIKNLWINADLIFKEASVKRLFFFVFLFFWWQFCVVDKVAILDPLQRFSQIWLQAKYQSNVLQKHPAIFLTTTYLKHA